MAKRAHIVLASALFLLGGCAYTSPIQPAASSKPGFEGAVYGGESVIISPNAEGTEEYRVFHQGGTGFVSIQTVRDGAERQAEKFCGRRGKAMQPLRETMSKPPYILGNFPRVEIVFTCTEKPKSGAEDITYMKLINLKKLLDVGVITQAEFDREKAKILSRP